MMHNVVGAVDLFRTVDAIKLRTSVTLLDAASGGGLFSATPDCLFGSDRDAATPALLQSA